jgi:hypothetical protein
VKTLPDPIGADLVPPDACPSNALPLSGGRPSAADHPLQRLVGRLLNQESEPRATAIAVRVFRAPGVTAHVHFLPAQKVTPGSGLAERLRKPVATFPDPNSTPSAKSVQRSISLRRITLAQRRVVGFAGGSGASNLCDFALLVVAGWSLGAPGRFISRIPSACGRCVLAVEWATYAKAAAVEDVGVDHGRADVFVAKQSLKGADEVAVIEPCGRLLKTGLPRKGSGQSHCRVR